jgi:Uma2 family endonuclease
VDPSTRRQAVERAPIQGADGYTWADVQSWPEDERWEIIGGVAYAMTAPTTWHQWLIGRLSDHIGRHLEGRECVRYMSPIGVKLSESDVVEPDVVVVCDRSQIKATHIEGAPALVIEVLSPSTMKHDRSRKMELYARNGVREYWVVQVYPACIEVLILDGASYRIAAVYEATETLTSPTLAGLEIDLKQVYDFPNESPGIQLIKEDPAPYGSQ